MAQHAEVYAAIAERVYVPTLQPDYAYIHWRGEYELAVLSAAYEDAYDGTAGFTRVAREDIAGVLREHPAALRVFRLLLGFTRSEFAETCGLLVERLRMPAVSKSRVDSIENGRSASDDEAATCAAVIDLVMNRDPNLFPPPPEGSALRLKIDKPDTERGWDSVRRYAVGGVPLDVFLHQRGYGGAFRQLLDATSGERGDLLEDPVEQLFRDNRVPFLRTGTRDQGAIVRRWGLTVRPAPDFVLFDSRTDTLRAILECKGANDGGTARDKASRFRALRVESQRLGGVPLFAVLAGIGWRRTSDALGPVVAHTDGRVFTLATLPRILETEPVPGLIGLDGYVAPILGELPGVTEPEPPAGTVRDLPEA
jgi:transcriptional regulator with XRE-family HTH domain